MSRASLLQDDNVIDVSPFIVNDDEIQAKHAQAEADKRKNKLLIFSFIAMVFFGLGNKIFQIIQMTAIINYPLFLSNFTTFVYVPLSYLYVWPMQRWGSQITPEMEAIPKSAFLYIGALDSLAGIMQVLSINYIQNGTLVVLIMQMAIPISMIISKYSLGAKYRLSQYIGCLIVAAGLATVLIPTFLEKKAADECSTDADPLTMGISMIVLVVSNIPMCLSTVVKEKVLGDADIDAIYLNFWVAFFQFFIGIPLILPAAPTVNVAIKDIPRNLVDGFKCYLGTNTIIKPDTVQAAITALGTAVAGASVPAISNFASRFSSSGRTTDFYAAVAADDDDKCDKKHYDDCAMAPIYVNLYMFFNVIYNILIILIIKYGSANILWIAMTVMVPLSSVAFSLDFMPNHKALKPTDIIGLVVIMGGLVTYRFYTQIRHAMCGKTIQDLAEEQLLDTDAARASTAINSSSHASEDQYEDVYQAGNVRPGSFSGRSDSYMPAVLDEYNEAALAPGVEENQPAKKKKKGSKRK